VKLSCLGESAEDLLNAFVTGFSEIPGFDLPANQYVGAGMIPWDGEGIYVYLGSSLVGQPGAPITRNIPRNQAIFTVVTFFVMLIRECSSFGYYMSGAPAPASNYILNSEGIRALNDAGALIQVAKNLRQGTSIVKNAQAGFAIGPVQALGPEGGLAAMRLQLDISIEQ
jgi:hypothetical protein